MKAAWTISAGLLCAAACSSPSVTIRGVLVPEGPGPFRMKDCDTGEVIELGVMADVPYVAIRRRIAELSQAGRYPVLLRVKGVPGPPRPSAAEPKPTRLELPVILEVVRGDCSVIAR